MEGHICFMGHGLDPCLGIFQGDEEQITKFMQKSLVQFLVVPLPLQPSFSKSTAYDDKRDESF